MNTYILRYASGRPFKAISCEQMAARAAMEIGSQLVKEKISVKAVICTIIGSNSARLTATWRNA
jgi:hypothetical protein